MLCGPAHVGREATLEPAAAAPVPADQDKGQLDTPGGVQLSLIIRRRVRQGSRRRLPARLTDGDGHRQHPVLRHGQPRATRTLHPAMKPTTQKWNHPCAMQPRICLPVDYEAPG